jgi:Tfp pilus assembly protein PilF
MNRNILVVLIAAALLSAAACLTLLIVFILPSRPPLSLNELLARADDALNRSYWEEAEQAVSRAGAAAAAPEEMLRVLKRRWLLARATDDYGPLREYALDAAARHPDNPALYQTALFACLRSGDPARAASLSHAFPGLPAVQSLEAEAAIAAGADSTDPALTGVPLYARSRGLTGQRDPEQFMTAGRDLDDPRYFLDAALLYMNRGEPRSAAAAASRYLLQKEFDEPAGLFAYAAGDFKTAASRLTQAASGQGNRPDLYLVAGDSLLAAADPAGAAVLYEAAVTRSRDFSSLPYLRLAYIRDNQNRPDEASRWLERAATALPDDKNAVAAHALRVAAAGGRANARQVLESYLAGHPDDADMLFLTLQFEGRTYSTERLLIRLRAYYFEHPENEDAARLLVAALLADRDTAGVRTVLLHFDERHPDTPRAWAASAWGCLDALAGRVERAVDRFSLALRLEDVFEHRYNRAVSLMAAGNLAAAEEDLERALMLLAGRPAADRWAALTHVRLAALYASQGDKPTALRSLDTALGLDPQNAEAYRLKKSLERGGL